MRGYQLYNAVAQLQSNNNNTLAGLSYDDFKKALGEPTRYEYHGAYYDNSHNIHTGWVCEWGDYLSSYRIEVVFDRITKKFYHLADEILDKTRDDWYKPRNTNTGNTKTNSNTNSSNSLGIIGVLSFLTFFIMYMILG